MNRVKQTVFSLSILLMLTGFVFGRTCGCECCAEEAAITVSEGCCAADACTTGCTEAGGIERDEFCTCALTCPEANLYLLIDGEGAVLSWRTFDLAASAEAGSDAIIQAAECAFVPFCGDSPAYCNASLLVRVCRFNC